MAAGSILARGAREARATAPQGLAGKGCGTRRRTPFSTAAAALPRFSSAPSASCSATCSSARPSFFSPFAKLRAAFFAALSWGSPASSVCATSSASAASPSWVEASAKSGLGPSSSRNAPSPSSSASFAAAATAGAPVGATGGGAELKVGSSNPTSVPFRIGATPNDASSGPLCPGHGVCATGSQVSEPQLRAYVPLGASQERPKAS